MTPCLALPNTRTEAEVRAARLSIVPAADPNPLTGMDRVMADCIANMPPFPGGQPMMPRSPFINMLGRITDVSANIAWEREQRAGAHQPPSEPCSAPRRRFTQSHTPHCVCGWPMGAHRNG